MVDRCPALAFFAGLALALSCAVAIAAPSAFPAGNAAIGVLTVVEGTVTLLRAGHRWQAAPGVRVGGNDIVETGSAAWVRIEWPQGPVLDLGGDSRVLLATLAAHPSAAANTEVGAPTEAAGAGALAAPPMRNGTTPMDPPAWPAPYVLAGWVKLTVPEQARSFTLTAAALALSAPRSIAVMQVAGASAAVFVEAGTAQVQDRRRALQATRNLNAGDALQASPGKTAAVTLRPDAAFLSTMPAAFRDTLPTRLARWQATVVAPRSIGPVAYDEVAGWLGAEPLVRRTLVSAWRERANDVAFRTRLIVHLSRHPEWEPVLFPEVGPRKAQVARVRAES